MGATRNWFTFVKKKFIKTSQRKIRTIHSSSRSDHQYANLASSSTTAAPSQSQRERREVQDVAATKIQAVFRGHLARRAYRALKSLVKMQALVRGALVRKQSQIALHCMQALVRMQVRLRTQQLLSRCGDD